MRLKHLVAAMIMAVLWPMAALAQQADSEARALRDEWSRLSRAGQIDEAIAVAQKRLSLAERLHGHQSESVANVLGDIGDGYGTKRDDARAEPYYLRALAIYEKLPPAQQNYWMCSTMRELGWIAYRRDDRDAVVRYRERALACVEARQGPTNSATILFMGELGDAYFPGYPLVGPKNRPEWIAKADELFQRWLPIVQGAKGPASLQEAELLTMEAKVHSRQGAPDKARETRLRALAIAEKQPDPAKPDQDRLDLEVKLLEMLKYAHPSAGNPEYLAYQVRLVAAEEKLYGPSSSRSARSRAYLADLRSRYPDIRPEMPSLESKPAAPAPVHQAAASAQNTGSPGGTRVVQAAAGKGGKPVWPTDMEPGNLYFVVDTLYDGWDDRAPVMVAAAAPQEAVDRLRRAKEAVTERTERYRLIAGGECKGPAWGAVVVGNGGRAWGGGCGKTPAQAIEAAFAACRQNGSANCEAIVDNSGKWPNVSLALSGSSSWSGGHCDLCLPAMNDRFGSFNAFTDNAYLDTGFITGMQDAISKIGKPCHQSYPCFYTSATVGCFHETPSDTRGSVCADALLTPNGYSGPIRRQR